MMKDKDALKNEAFYQYQKKVGFLFAVPAGLQLAHICYINRAAHVPLCKYLRQLKVMALLGSFGCVWYEKIALEKKWQFYNRFYPEPTQLQRSLVAETQVYLERDLMGLKEATIEEKAHLDPESQMKYEQMYSLGTQSFPEPHDLNPSGIAPHWGKS